MQMTPLQQRFKEAIEKQDLTITHELYGIHITKLSPVEIHASASACESITLEMMGEFAEWADAEGYHQVRVGGIWQNSMDAKIPQEKEFTTPELIQKFLKREGGNGSIAVRA